MDTLAKTAVILICALCIGLQHLFNYWIRKDLDESPMALFGILGIVLSYIALGFTITKAIEVW